MGTDNFGYIYTIILYFAFLVNAQKKCSFELTLFTYYSNRVQQNWNVRYNLEERQVTENIRQVNCENISDLGEVPLHPRGTIQGIKVTSSFLNTLAPFQTNRVRDTVLKLELTQNNLSQVIPGFFTIFPKLQYLNLAQNNISVVIEGGFHQLTSLYYLNMSNNRINVLNSHAFIGPNKLSTVDLSFNRLNQIPEDIFQYQQYIRNVNVSHNNFTTFINIQKVDYLDLSYNKIQNISTIKNFYIVNLSFNKLIRINNIENVTFLNASHNSLCKVQINDVKIKILDLSFNNLTRLEEDSFKHATNLQELYLQHNFLKTMPSNIFIYMSLLRSLDISYNNFSLYQHGINNNWLNILSPSGLKTVYLEHNNWTCDDLRIIVYNLHSRKIQLIKSKSEYNNTNVLGLECLEKGYKGNFANELLPDEVLDQINLISIQLKSNISQLTEKTDFKINNIKNDILLNINTSLDAFINNKIKDSETKLTRSNNESIQSLESSLKETILKDINAQLVSSFCKDNQEISVTQCFTKTIENILESHRKLSNENYERKLHDMNSKLQNISEALVRLQSKENDVPIADSNTIHDNSNQNIYKIASYIILQLLLILIICVLFGILYFLRKRKASYSTGEQISLM